MANHHRHATAHTSTLLWCLIALPVAIHFALLWLYAVNAPRLDDFSETLVFLNRFSEATNINEKLDAFFSVYRGHRHTLSHLIYLTQQPLDFRLVSLLGNGLLLLYTALFAATVKELPQRKILLLVSVYLIFNLQSWRGMFWPLGTWGTQAVLILSFACFILATQHKKLTIFPAIIIGVLASFTYVNGIFVWPIVACYLLAKKENTNILQQKELWIWGLAATMTLLFYFHNYQIGNPAETASSIEMENIPQLAFNILKNFLAMPGSILIFNDIKNPWKADLSTFIGALEITVISWLLIKGGFKKTPALIMLLAFTLMTMMVIAATRSATSGTEQSLQGHYKLYNSTMLFLLGTGIINWAFENKQNAYASIRNTVFISAALLYLAAIFLFAPTAISYQQKLAEDTRQWLFSHTLQLPDTRFYISLANKRLANAVRTHNYDPWQLLQETETPFATEKVDCPTRLQSLAAEIKSQKHANAVFLTLDIKEKISDFYLCSPLQAMRITVMDKSYTENKNGTYSLKLWVRRDTAIKEDAGPWQLYLMDN